MTDHASVPMNEIQRAYQAFLKAERILIISHKNPDADSIGANVALREALESLGKKVDSACFDPVPENCNFLRSSDEFIRQIRPENYDLIVTVDCGSHLLMKFHEIHPILLNREQCFLINIDHHATNDFFGNINIVMPETPSTCFMLYLMFTMYGWKMTSTMATAMLHGLYFDTGSFQHSNTDSATLRIAARLTHLGADLEHCVKKHYKSSSISQLRLWGKALERAQKNSKNMVVSYLNSHDFFTENAERDDSSGLINYLNHVPDALCCLLLTEDRHGNIKASMRTQSEKIDLPELTRLFGGGGHKKAAGFTVPGRLKETRQIEVRV